MRPSRSSAPRGSNLKNRGGFGGFEQITRTTRSRVLTTVSSSIDRKRERGTRTAAHERGSLAAAQFKRMTHLLRTLLHREDSQAWNVQLAAAIKTCPSRLLLLVQGATEANTDVLKLLTEVFDITARVAPTCDVVPLLPCAGWTEELVVEMVSVSALLTPPSPPPQDLDLYQRLRSRHSPDNPPQLIQLDCTNITSLSPHHSPPSSPSSPPALSHANTAPPTYPKSTTSSQPSPDANTALPTHRKFLTSSQPSATTPHMQSAQSSGTPQGGPGMNLEADLKREASAPEGASEGPSETGGAHVSRHGVELCGEQRRPRVYAFKRVALGGTFDRLHAGHRLLLSAAAVVCTDQLYIGVTADALLAKKANRNLLQGYDQRVADVERYVKAVNPSVNIETGALSDPKEPTAAELQPDMGAIVVSEETIPGAQAINEGRKARGFAPLEIIVVGLVGLDAGGQKLSSTALRSLEALVHKVV